MTPDEKDKILEALRPFREQAWNEGYAAGKDEGIRSVYLASMVQMERDVIAARGAGEQDAAVMKTKPFREWMRETWPALCQ